MKSSLIKSILLILLSLSMILCTLPACSSDAGIPSTEDTEASADINTGVSNSPDEPSDTTDPIEPIDPFIPKPPVAPILPNPEDLVNVKQYIPSIFIDLRYSGTNNILGDNIYDYKDAYLRFGTVKKLNEVQKELEAQGLSLKIWDAYRPLDAQNTLSLVLPDYGTSPTEAYKLYLDDVIKVPVGGEIYNYIKADNWKPDRIADNDISNSSVVIAFSDSKSNDDVISAICGANISSS